MGQRRPIRTFAAANNFSVMTIKNKPTTPRWVKVSGVVVLFLILGLVIMHLSGHGFHHH
jgi:hypothetical protein